MPDATFQSDLMDRDRFYQHIGVHAESWYSYANGPGMGRRVANGNLCLVIGCDKTTSWGIATCSSSFEQTISKLQFRPVISGDSGRFYTWEHSGTADSPRVGPDGGQSLRNQCVFIRYLNFKLHDSLWPGFREPTGVQIQMESHQSSSSGSKQSNSGSSRKFGSTLSRFLRSAFSSGGKDSEAPLDSNENSLEIIAETYEVSVCVHPASYLVGFNQGCGLSANPIFLDLPQ